MINYAKQYSEYIEKVRDGNFKPAVKIEWLNTDESVNFDFTNSLFDINVSISVNYQNGSRRSCTVSLNNDRNRIPIDFNNVWIGQKFKVWMGVYLDDDTPFYLPQGVFYVTNPSEVYNPETRSITLNGVDKWAYLDGTLFGYLTGTYQTDIGVDLFDATRKLLCISRFSNQAERTTDVTEMIDPVAPLLSPILAAKKTIVDGHQKNVTDCPYTVKTERGKTYADILLEYATILCAAIYYDVNGRLVIEPLIDTADDITDTDKEILWNFTVDEKSFMGLSQTSNFDKVYNDIIVLGNILNGYQFKGRVQNRNPKSDTCIERIGLKTKPPIEDNQYYSDEQCEELAKYHAKVDTILQKSGDIKSTPIFHLDVNKIVTVSTPNNKMSKEMFLVSGYTLTPMGNMSVNVTSINVLKDFSVVEVGMYE